MKAFMFPGQGSQFVGMGKDLFSKYPYLVQEADEILGYSVEKLCNDTDGRLNQTEYTQPALFVVNTLMYNLYQEENGGQPVFLLGHSLGEYNALLASGALTFSQALYLVKERGMCMSRAPKGAMAAIVGMERVKIESLLAESKLSDIDVANLNSRTQIVISGPDEQIKLAEELFTDLAMYHPLKTSGAFHSRQMIAASAEYSKVLSSQTFEKFEIPVVANSTADIYPDIESAGTILKEQIYSSVRWHDSIVNLLRIGVNNFIQIGPGDVLEKLVKNVSKDYEKNGSDTSINDSPHLESYMGRKNEAQDVTQSDYSAAKFLVDDWNKRVEIGDAVAFKDNSDYVKTRSEAMLLFDSKAVVYLKGTKGYYELTDLREI